MSKKLKKFLIPLICILAVFAIARISNILLISRTRSAANYPSLNPGERFFASRLITPTKFSLICYRWQDEYFGNHARVHRLCGIEGDTVEIRDGNLLVNGILADSNFSVARNYIVSKTEIEKIKEVENLEDNNVTFLNADSIITTLCDKNVIEHKIPAQRKTLPKTYIDPGIAYRFSKEWNQDHFGPIVVPKDSYFVLGDNRNSSEDSRYLGFIPKSHLIATVIGE